MQFKVLCIGDVVGRPGCRTVSQVLPKIQKQHDLDCVIANVENAAGGSGLTTNLYEKFIRYGVTLMTLGDHVYRRADIIPTLEQSHRIVRPANYPPRAPGREMTVYETKDGHLVALICVMGRLFMRPATDCPFRTVDRLIESLDDRVKLILVDMHAEATSEKIAMGWHLDGRASLVFGTHTHVQTADERVLPKGTGHISDLGMTGAHDGILGRRRDPVLQVMTTNVPAPFDVADGDLRLCGIIATLDTETGRCSNIVRLVETFVEDSTTSPE